MKNGFIVISKEAPSRRDAIWAKPVEGGFTLYMLTAGAWKPLKVMDENNTSGTSDDSVINVKNKADKVSSATNNNLASLNSNGNLKDSGYKASDFEAAGARTELIGSVQDEKTANTINGAKAFAADQAATLLGTDKDTSEDMTLYGLKAYIDAQISTL